METGRENSSDRRPGARPRLFISYRRRSDQAYARLLKEGLTRAFGEGAVFRDVDDIRPGEAFPETIREAVESSDVFLLLVSPGWVELIGGLHNPDDFVRREIAAALACGVPLVPLLLGGARMPKADELPEEIRDLAFRQGLELSDDRWDYDVGRLVRLVRARAGLSEPVPFFGRLVAPLRRLIGTRLGKAAAVALALFIAAGFVIRYDLFGGDFEGCVRRYTPDVLGGVARLTSETYDEPVVSADEYQRMLEHRNDPDGVPLVIWLSDSGDEVGAVFLSYFRGDDFNRSSFKVERIIEPKCADVQEYRNYGKPAADKHYLTNWDTLRVRLGERDYYLRIGDKGNYITATFTTKLSH